MKLYEYKYLVLVNLARDRHTLSMVSTAGRRTSTFLLHTSSNLSVSLTTSYIIRNGECTRLEVTIPQHAPQLIFPSQEFDSFN